VTPGVTTDPRIAPVGGETAEKPTATGPAREEAYRKQADAEFEDFKNFLRDEGSKEGLSLAIGKKRA